MIFVLTALLCVILVELAVRLPFATAISRLAAAGGRSVRILRSKSVSDHWKEKAIGAYARMTFRASMELATFLGLVLLAASALIWVFEQAVDGFQDFILGWGGIGFTVVFASLYLAVRSRLLRS